MALLSTKYKFLMIHVTKTAGTSLSEVLSAEAGHPIEDRYRKFISDDGIGDAVPNELTPHGINIHDNVRTIRSKVEHEIDLDEYFKFCFVRNPWARIYSFYNHLVRKNRTAGLPKDRRGKVKGFNDCLLESNTLLLQPQMWWMCDSSGDIDVDFVGKCESINQDLQTISDRIGFEKAPTLGRRNVSSGVPPYREAYSNETRELIYHYYRHEIEFFKYEFS